MSNNEQKLSAFQQQALDTLKEIISGIDEYEDVVSACFLAMMTGCYLSFREDAMKLYPDGLTKEQYVSSAKNSIAKCMEVFEKA